MSKRDYPRLLPAPRSSFFLFGARGTGKSTWLRRHFAEARYVDLLDERRYQRLLAEPGQFHDELSALPAGSWVAVDEIQRLPALLNEVHRLIEERRLKFALTGSSARKLKRGGVNLLAGRALRRAMFPLTPAEMGGDFDLQRTLRFGSLPLVVAAEEPEATLEAYVRMYLREEIQAEALVRNLAGFSRFLPVAALFHGQVLNLSAVARDAGVTRSTAQGFFEILEDTLLARTLPAFEGRLRVRERKHPKLYWIDAGIVRAARGHLSPLSTEETGPLLEGFVHTLLVCEQETFGEIDQLAYWAPAEAVRVEVDFVVRRGKELTAIEVKSSARLRSEDLLGLEAVASLPGLKRRILVYGGRERLRREGVDVLPFAEFARELADRKL
jgi:predicted AAA+ superfamily ATPase